VGAQSGTTATVKASNPGNWSVTANAVPLGYTGVQLFPNVQQMTNNWGANGPKSGSSDTPLNSLNSLVVHYNETSPTGPNDIYEFAPDVWTNYAGQNGPGSGDIMFWADTHGRCNAGAYGGTVLGHAVLDGQNWTVHRYGGPGAEIIFVLDGAGGSGTCAQQSSGDINIKAGLNWLASNGFIQSPVIIGDQLNTGWEITSADHSTFTMNSYSITTG